MSQNSESADEKLLTQSSEQISKLENTPEKETIKVDDFEPKKIKLEDKIRNSFFILLCIEYAISSMDGGIIPKQNSALQIDFEDEDENFKVGIFSSIDYIGRIFGAILMSILMDRMSRKTFFSGCCVTKAIFLMIAIFTPNYEINLIARLLSGVPQTLLTCYAVVWTVQFAKKKYRTLMMPIAQFSALLGLILGYGLAYLCEFILGDSNLHAWRLSFFIEGILLIIFAVIFFSYPRLYFSSTFYLNEDDDYYGKEKSKKEIEEEKKKSTTEKFCTQLPKILCTKLFLFTSIANTVSFFGMRVIQFYADKYMDVILNVKKRERLIHFIILCITGPSAGAILGGIICSKIGGYASKNGMWMMLILTIIASFSSTMITISTIKIFFLIACWIYFFCLAAVTPLAGGLIISALPNELKGSGYSVNMFFLNGIGSFPGPAVYSLIADFIQENNPDIGNEYYRKAMEITMYYNYVGLVLMIIASVLRFRIEGDLSNDNVSEEQKGGRQLSEVNNESS